MSYTYLMNDKIKVFVAGTTSEGTGAYTWFHTAEAADREYEHDLNYNTPRAHRFDLYVKNGTSEEITAQVEKYWDEHF